jgi:Alpha/beta hydrolase domain
MDPASIGALKRFNAARYAPLSFANPNPAEACAAGGRGGANAAPATSDVEEGLKWDMISQVGALLKSNAPGHPMAGFNVQYLYMTSQDAAQTTYINAIQRHAVLANGKPVYDGHVIKSGGRPARIRRCAAAPGNGDPRVAVRNAGVPVINVLQQGDVLGALALRRADSDDPADRYRLYEIAGTAHSSPPPYRTATPVIADLIAADGEGAVVTRKFSAAIGPYTLEAPLKEPGRCQPSELVTEQPILAYMFHGAYANIDQWVRTGMPAPKGARTETKEVDGKPVFVNDEVGNNLGGVRSPYVDVPTRIYHPGHGNQPGCGNNFGYSEPLNFARLDALYGSYKNYAAKVTQSVDRLLKERWVTPSDAQRIKAELLAPPTGSSSKSNASN